MDPSVEEQELIIPKVEVLIDRSTGWLKDPEGIDFDEAGRLYVANYGFHTVVALDLEKMTCNTVSGQHAIHGSSNSMLHSPRGIVCCKQLQPGVIYLANSNGNCVKKFDPLLPIGQSLSIVIGTGAKGAERREKQIRAALEPEVGQLASQIDLNRPFHIAIDDAEHFMTICCPLSCRIYRIWMGDEEEKWKISDVWNFFDGTNGIMPCWSAFNPDNPDKFWFLTHCSFRELTMTNDEEGFTAQILAGHEDRVGYADGPALTALFNWVQSCLIVEADLGLTAYLCDCWNHRIRKYCFATDMVTTVIGSGRPFVSPGSPMDCTISYPSCIALSGNDLIIANGGAMSMSVCRNFVQKELVQLAGNIVGPHHITLVQTSSFVENTITSNRIIIHIST